MSKRQNDKFHTGKFIRLVREIAGIDASTLAERSGISRNGLLNIEMGKVSPRLSTIEAIAGGMGLTTTTLFELAREYEMFEKSVMYAVGIKGEDAAIAKAKEWNANA